LDNEKETERLTMTTIEQLSILEHKVFDGRPQLDRKLPDITTVLGEPPCYRCVESLSDFCDSKTCHKLTAWLLGRHSNGATY
jgi:hypothetical protein